MIARAHIDRRVKWALVRALQAHGRKGTAAKIHPNDPRFGGGTVNGINVLRKEYGMPETGLLTPALMVKIGPFISGSIGARAAIALAFFEGDIETVANNIGPTVQALQTLGTDAAGGNWPYCAAGQAFGLRCAGWRHWQALTETLGDTWVPGLYKLAQDGKLGLSVVSWDSQASSSDPWSHLIAFQFDRDPALDHVGRTTTRRVNGMVWTIEANTGPGAGANQADGDGVWQRHRSLVAAKCIRHASR